MIQFISVTMLYIIGSNLSDFQFLYIDLFVLVPLSILMGRTEAYRNLTPHLPSGSLLSLPVLTSVLGSVVIQAIFQIFTFFFVTWFDFYRPHEVDPNSEDQQVKAFENTSLFYVSIYQYLMVCVVYSISKPFRQPLYTNLYFTLSLIILLAFGTYIVLTDDSWVINLFELESTTTMTFRLYLLIIVVVNSIVTYLFEKIAVWYISVWWRARKERKVVLERQQEI